MTGSTTPRYRYTWPVEVKSAEGERIPLTLVMETADPSQYRLVEQAAKHHGIATGEPRVERIA